MKLKLISPSEVILLDDIVKIKAEDPRGNFCLLSNHIDFVTAILPGILSYEKKGAGEKFFAVDEGILVKKGFEVTVTTRNAIAGEGLGSLRNAVKEKIEALDEMEKKNRAILMKLESEILRHFGEL